MKRGEWGCLHILVGVGTQSVLVFFLLFSFSRSPFSKNEKQTKQTHQMLIFRRLPIPMGTNLIVRSVHEIVYGFSSKREL